MVHDKINLAVNVDPTCKTAGTGPNLVFAYGGKRFTLKPGDYTTEMETDTGKACSSAVAKMEGTLLDKIGKIAPNNPTQVIVMGDAFLRRVYTAFDNSDPAKPRVGFSMAKDASEVDLDDVFAEVA